MRKKLLRVTYYKQKGNLRKRSEKYLLVTAILFDV